jgi:hypothetical protein
MTSNLPKVSILYSNGNLMQDINVLDGIMGLVGTGYSPALLNNPKTVYNLLDAEAQGFTASAEPVAHRHIKEFYQELGGDQELHIMLVPETVKMSDMLDDTNEEGAKKLLRSATGRIRILSVFRKPDNAYDAGENFIDADVEDTLLKSKIFAQARLAELAPIGIIIEGRVANMEVLATATYTVTTAGENGNTVELTSDQGLGTISLGSYTVVTGNTVNDVAAGLRAAINLQSSSTGYKASGNNASVVITAPVGSGVSANAYELARVVTGTAAGTIVNFAGGSDSVANTLEPSTFSNGFASVLLGGTLADGSASVGLTLGRLSKYGAHIKIGKVANGPLSASELYIGSKPVKDILALDTLHGAGFLSFMKHPGLAGYYFGKDRMASTDDYRLMVYRRLIDKAAIVASAVYIQKLEGEVQLEPSGNINTLVLAAMSTEISQQISLSMGDQISGLEVYINPNQNIIETETLVVKLRLQPLGYTTYINVDLGITTQLN